MPWAQARATAYGAPAPMEPVRRALAQAQGGCLAAALRAETPVPAFDCAGMDGYAVGSLDGPWVRLGRVLAGAAETAGLAAGQAVEIATGAPIPAGTVAVLRYEHAERTGDLVRAVVGRVGAGPGRDIRYRGEDIPDGVDLVPAGAAVTPTVLGLAATVGLDALLVRPRPRVAALTTGDEIVTRGRPGRGWVRDGVGPQLPGLVADLGGELVSLEQVPDLPADRLAGALAGAAAEVVVTCGGAGPGPADLLRAALGGLGATLVVDGVACRPGHPQRLARIPDGRWVVALPGNPFAAVVAALTLLGPLVAGLTGRPLRPLPTACLAAPTSRPATPAPAPPTPGDAVDRTRLVPVRWRDAGVVEALGRDRPGNLWGVALADALAVIPPGWQGGQVALLTLPGGSAA